MEIFQHRSGLGHTLRALRAGHLTIGFLGGSITDARARHNWPEAVTRWFVEQYPDVRIQVENAAIGATGSDLAVFRAQRDIIDRNCDLVFVEYAANDIGLPTELRGRTREGLLRKLLATQRTDIVLPYTFCQVMYEEMMRGEIPATISEFETLAEHYGLGSVWMGQYSLNEIKAGRMRWEEWLPDGVHPDYRGSLSYAQSIITFLERELLHAPSTCTMPFESALPAPLDPLNWESATYLPFSALKLDGPWVTTRWPMLEWIDVVLETAAVGAKLSFTFDGRVLALGFDFGTTSSEFRYRVDGGGWITEVRDRPSWVPPRDGTAPALLVTTLQMARMNLRWKLSMVTGLNALELIAAWRISVL